MTNSLADVVAAASTEGNGKNDTNWPLAEMVRTGRRTAPENALLLGWNRSPLLNQLGASPRECLKSLSNGAQTSRQPELIPKDLGGFTTIP
jgi:hypothetical protein